MLLQILVVGNPGEQQDETSNCISPTHLLAPHIHTKGQTPGKQSVRVTGLLMLN